MCLILIAWQVHPKYPLIVAANRDEYYERSTAALGFWKDAPQILAGRDLQAGGTWLGVRRDGRFAALTNVRNFYRPSTTPRLRSRGLLVSDYLSNPVMEEPLAVLQDIQTRAAEYDGFNLLLASFSQLAWFSNEDGPPRLLDPGIYGLSNGLLDTPWPKLNYAKEEFQKLLASMDKDSRLVWQAKLFKLLTDEQTASDDYLPDTGIGLEWERRLSPIFVRSPYYGTRASTLLLISVEGAVYMTEQTYDYSGLAGEPQSFCI